MSKISVGRGSSNGTVGSEIKFAGNDKEKMYEPKHRRKLVRVLTVIAYLFSVSLAAIMLSLFYVFIYNPGKPTKDSAFSQLLTPTHSYESKQESLKTAVNETYLNMDRKESRALLILAGKNSIQSSSQVLSSDHIYLKDSDGLKKKNKTIYL